MKILHITTSVVPQSAAYRIHEGLLRQNIDSMMLVTTQSVEQKNIICSHLLNRKIKVKLSSFVENRFVRLFLRVEGSPFSAGTVSNLDYQLIQEMQPDIIHLHWICGACMSVKDFAFLSRFRLVWTLHDSWAFTGGCHIPYSCLKYESSCSSCEQLKENSVFDLSNYIWRRKNKYYKDLQMHLVAPSQWLARCAKRSFLFKEYPVAVITNGIDTNLYKPINKFEAKNLLGINREHKIILFGAINSTTDTNKGFQFLKQAIEVLSRKLTCNETIEIVIFGSNEPLKAPNFGFKTTYIGRLHDDISLVVLYSAADVMLVPSKSENFPNTVLEAMACGTPVVGFDVGGIPEMIDHKSNGYLAQHYDSEDFANGIVYVLEDSKRWDALSQNARKKVVTHFDIHSVAEQYIELYKKIAISKSNSK